MEVAPFFRLEAKQADNIINNIKNAVAQWQDITSKYQISREETEFMSAAFRY